MEEVMVSIKIRDLMNLQAATYMRDTHYKTLKDIKAALESKQIAEKINADIAQLVEHI